MTYLDTPAESPLYADETGHIPNYLRVFALRPEAYAGWEQLAGSVRDGMDLRRYELVTIAAARRLGSDYCTLAHAKVLRERFYDEPQLRAIIADHRSAGLDPADVAIMDFADKVAADPTTITELDAATLRGYGLSDTDVLQVVLAVCIRRFFSGVLSAVGAAPDEALRG
ncbi:carboxymuconolactone decarboxylase family protein [Catellatospora vulcania]|uniref:carboxymuconolactone decarboxylase family protein n=1 Tax=Catellatospora vulcania TaxID=1460450 RepID=UPI0012D41B34|nr:carboxymuconolactone decarboxylase family protein [Catellatospora vulcania]